jgi:hypothetical protein
LYLKGSSSFGFDPPAAGATFLTALALDAAGALATGFLADDSADGFPTGFLAGAGASSLAAASF